MIYVLSETKISRMLYILGKRPTTKKGWKLGNVPINYFNVRRVMVVDEEFVHNSHWLNEK